MCQFGPTLGQQFFALIAEDAAKLVVHLEATLVGRCERCANQPEIEVASEAFLTAAQLLFGLTALDQLRGLPRVQIEEAQLGCGRSVRTAKVRRQDAEKLAAAADQGCGLNGAKARGNDDGQDRREGRFCQHVLDNHAGALLQRGSGGSHSFVHRREEIQEILLEATLGDDSQPAARGVVQLDVAEVGVE